MPSHNREYTTDIAAFLGANDIEREDERDELREAYAKGIEVGCFKAWQDNGQIFVSGWSETILRLPSDKSQAEFLRQLAAIKLEDESDEGYQHAINNPRS